MVDVTAYSLGVESKWSGEGRDKTDKGQWAHGVWTADLKNETSARWCSVLDSLLWLGQDDSRFQRTTENKIRNTKFSKQIQMNTVVRLRVRLRLSSPTSATVLFQTSSYTSSKPNNTKMTVELWESLNGNINTNNLFKLLFFKKKKILHIPTNLVYWPRNEGSRTAPPVFGG